MKEEEELYFREAIRQLSFTKYLQELEKY